MAALWPEPGWPGLGGQRGAGHRGRPGLLELAVSGQIGSAHRGGSGCSSPGCWAWPSPSSRRGCCPWPAGGFRPDWRRRRPRPVPRAPACRPAPRRYPDHDRAGHGLRAGHVRGDGLDLGRGNEHLVAAAEVGAPAVLTVGVPPGKNLGTIVDRADPGGRMAAAVDRYISLSSGSAGLTVLAVDPQRFARVAAWRPASPPGRQRTGRETGPASTGPGHPPRQCGAHHRGRARLSPPGRCFRRRQHRGFAGQPGRPACARRSPSPLADRLPVRAPGSRSQPAAAGAAEPGDRVGHHHRGAGPRRLGWVPAGAGLLSARRRWRPGHVDDPPDRLTASAAGLTWKFAGRPHQGAMLLSANRPYPLPAVVSGAMLSPGSASRPG